MKLRSAHTGSVNLASPGDRAPILRIAQLFPPISHGQMYRGVLLRDGPRRMLGYVTTHADSGDLGYRVQTQERSACAS